MPQVKDISPHLVYLAKEIKKCPLVTKVYVWGSYAKNIDKPNFRVKDIDIIVKTKVQSEDLIAIDENVMEKKLSDEELENQGYDPSAVKLSQSFIKFTKYNIDHWAISADDKLLHWGPILVDKKDADDAKKEAEKFATEIIGKNVSQKVSEAARNNWYSFYREFLNNQLSNMPSGWYVSEEKNLKNILSQASLID